MSYDINVLRNEKKNLIQKLEQLKAVNPEYVDRRATAKIGSLTNKINRIIKRNALEEKGNYVQAQYELTELRRFCIGHSSLVDRVDSIQKLLERRVL